LIHIFRVTLLDMATLTPEQNQAKWLLMSVVDKNGLVNIGRKSPNGKDYSDLSQCWAHTTSSSSSGYGQKMVRGKPWGLHRLSWWVHNGFPDETHDFWKTRQFEISHQCDNKACVNPDHLRLVSCSANKKEAVTRVRVLKEPKERVRVTVACYGCRADGHHACVGFPCSECVKHGTECIKEEPTVKPQAFAPGHGAGENNIKAVLSSEQVIAIRARKMAGLAYGGLKELAKEYPDVTYVTLQAILGRRDYRKADKPPGWDAWFDANK